MSRRKWRVDLWCWYFHCRFCHFFYGSFILKFVIWIWVHPKTQLAKHAVIWGVWRDPKLRTSVPSQVLPKNTGGLWSEFSNNYNVSKTRNGSSVITECWWLWDQDGSCPCCSPKIYLCIPCEHLCSCLCLCEGSLQWNCGQ